MKTKHAITGFVACLLLASCNFNVSLGEGTRGNGNVKTDERPVNGSFTAIHAQEGLDVHVTQANEASIRVEADENIIELIGTDIENGVLKIHAVENIGRASSKKVYVSVPTIEELKTSSGADLRVENPVKTDRISLKSSSGSDILVEVNAHSVFCDSSSGAEIKVTGTAKTIEAEASSGSEVDANGLTTEEAYAKASSGGSVSVNATEKVEARSSSGGDIYYSGNPRVVHKNNSVSGNVSNQ